MVGDGICADCFESTIRSAFEAALQHEQAHPVTWGPTELEPEDFGHLFSSEFKAQWREKMVEYRTPAAKRVYCQHLVHTGLEAATSAQEQTERLECGKFIGEYSSEVRVVMHMFLCPDCKGIVCLSCGIAVISNNAVCTRTGMHKCNPTRPDPMARFEGLVRGKDIQFCPAISCGSPITLSDGCNTIHCSSCQTSFCFICGIAAKHASGHWRHGSPCPRWNQPGAGNAHDDRAADPVERERYYHEQAQILRARAEESAWGRVTQMRLDLASIMEVLAASFADEIKNPEDPGPLPRHRLRAFLEAFSQNLSIYLYNRGDLDTPEWQARLEQGRTQHWRIAEDAEALGAELDRFPEFLRVYQAYLTFATELGFVQDPRGTGRMAAEQTLDEASFRAGAQELRVYAGRQVRREARRMMFTRAALFDVAATTFAHEEQGVFCGPEDPILGRLQTLLSALYEHVSIYIVARGDAGAHARLWYGRIVDVAELLGGELDRYPELRRVYQAYLGAAAELGLADGVA
ncbi:hypothetical protein LTR36_001301 [Oleoguttula mirabilis]|uniref:IBR domain-containing protein n=1 Tax=Oleoguttula mirabilis TaxID=1507867 RepID=A0AAV9JPG8_9PEZI|nr:hypothetical protein LTR36_001301 [Oleoguttula mirabilis]